MSPSQTSCCRWERRQDRRGPGAAGSGSPGGAATGNPLRNDGILILCVIPATERNRWLVG